MYVKSVIEGETVMKSFQQLLVTSEFHFANAMAVDRERSSRNELQVVYYPGEQTVVLLYNSVFRTCINKIQSTNGFGDDNLLTFNLVSKKRL